MPNAPEPYESDLEATTVECLDCGSLFGPEEGHTECPDCNCDALEYHHISDTPLGFDDDEDYRVYCAPQGLPDRWVYYAKEPNA